MNGLADLDHCDNQIPTDDGQYQPTNAASGAHSSIFTNASNVRFKNSKFSITNVHSINSSSMRVLYDRVAPNAILNEGGRADNPKCHPGTREEVINLVERWMDGTEDERIFWMSGPAGGGKTAIMKTVAERAAKRGVHTINFFFFRGDVSRNGVQPVVPTLLYQLFALYPSTKVAVDMTLSARPRILDESFTQQCKLLHSLAPLVQTAPHVSAEPIIVLLDGLDECDIDADRSQPDILRELESLVMEKDAPFRLLVASRAEARIQMTFNQLSSPVRSIFLDENYSPENDIRAFVQAEFDSIKASHPSRHLLAREWPLSADIEAIVTKSSGQFIYAATVMRYISHPLTVPSLGLERVKGISPAGNSSPFAHLDNIYAFILGRTHDHGAIRDILAVLQMSRAHCTDSQVLCWYDSRYNGAFLASCASELASIVQLNKAGNFDFYHASLADFLADQTRSMEHFIDLDAFRAKFIVELWKKSSDVIKTDDVEPLLHELFHTLRAPTSDITNMLLNLPVPRWIVGRGTGISSTSNPASTIQRLYFTHDQKTYKHILRRVIFATMSLDSSRYNPAAMYEIFDDTPFAKEYISSFRRVSWWSRLLNKIFGKK